MKITTFNPQIVTKDADSILQLFEELGFERRHTKTGIGEMDVTGIRMKDENGFYLDVSQAKEIQKSDKIAIRMNVDNFDEAYELLISRGFQNIYGDKTVDSGSARSALLVSPSGFGINLVQHIKK